MGPAGAGSLAIVVNAALANQRPLRRDDAPSSRASAPGGDRGVWEDTPATAPSSRPNSPPSGIAAAKAEEQSMAAS